jgi:hypothetical protein
MISLELLFSVEAFHVSVLLLHLSFFLELVWEGNSLLWYKSTVRQYSQGQIKGRVSRTAALGANLWEAIKHLWNKSEIWCQLTKVFTYASLHNCRDVNVNRRSISPAPTQTLNIYLQNIGLKRAQIYYPTQGIHISRSGPEYSYIPYKIRDSSTLESKLHYLNLWLK